MTEAAKPDLTGIYLEAHNDSLFEPEDQKFGRVLSIEEAAQALRIGPSVLEGEIGFSRLGTVALRKALIPVDDKVLATETSEESPSMLERLSLKPISK